MSRLRVTYFLAGLLLSVVMTWAQAPRSTWIASTQTAAQPAGTLRLSADDRKAATDEKRLVLEERRATIEDKRLALEERRATIEDRRIALEEPKYTSESNGWRLLIPGLPAFEALIVAAVSFFQLQKSLSAQAQLKALELAFNGHDSDAVKARGLVAAKLLGKSLPRDFSAGLSSLTNELGKHAPPLKSLSTGLS